MKNLYLIPLSLAVLIALVATVKNAHAGEVLCESILYPGTTQVFNGRCPRNWVPV